MQNSTMYIRHNKWTYASSWKYIKWYSTEGRIPEKNQESIFLNEKKKANSDKRKLKKLSTVRKKICTIFWINFRRGFSFQTYRNWSYQRFNISLIYTTGNLTSCTFPECKFLLPFEYIERVMTVRSYYSIKNAKKRAFYFRRSISRPSNANGSKNLHIRKLH